MNIVYIRFIIYFPYSCESLSRLSTFLYEIRVPRENIIIIIIIICMHFVHVYIYTIFYTCVASIDF